MVSNEEIACTGCSSHKACAYGMVDCTRRHGVDKCNQCKEFSCDKIEDILGRSKEYQEKCKEVCSEEYVALEKTFFDKENNFRK